MKTEKDHCYTCRFVRHYGVGIPADLAKALFPAVEPARRLRAGEATSGQSVANLCPAAMALRPGGGAE